MPVINKTLSCIAVFFSICCVQAFAQQPQSTDENPRSNFELAVRNYPGKRIDLFVDGMNSIEKSNRVEVFLIQYNNRFVDYEMHPEKGMLSIILNKDTDIKDLMEAFENNNFKCSFIDADGYRTTVSPSGNLIKVPIKK
jgi:hypothetical protein